MAFGDASSTVSSICFSKVRLLFIPALKLGSTDVIICISLLNGCSYYGRTAGVSGAGTNGSLLEPVFPITEDISKRFSAIINCKEADVVVELLSRSYIIIKLD